MATYLLIGTSHSFAACRAIRSNTGWVAPGEATMACSEDIAGAARSSSFSALRMPTSTVVVWHLIAP